MIKSVTYDPQFVIAFECVHGICKKNYAFKSSVM